jgi:hypothetical protein
MLARAPDDITRANAAQLKRSPSPERSPHPTWGNGAVCPATPGANARRASERADQGTRTAYSAQISQRRAAGTRCAAGQLTELRADCAADGHGGQARARQRLNGPTAFAHPRGPGAESARGLALLDDRRRNTAALAHLVPAPPRPRPDLRAPLTARAGACPAPPSGGADLARVAGVLARSSLASAVHTSISCAVPSKENETASLPSTSPS